MKAIWMLAAAAMLTACAGRGEDDMGAAPDRGEDTTTVTTGVDTTTFDTTTGGVGQTAEPGMVPDTAAADVEEYPTTPTDTTMQDPGMTGDTTTTGVPSDTTVGADTTTGYGDPSVGVDTTGTYGAPADTGTYGAPSDTSTWGADTSMVEHDTTQAQ